MSEFPRSLAVVIGINNYQNGIDTLQTAVADARNRYSCQVGDRYF